MSSQPPAPEGFSEIKNAAEAAAQKLRTKPLTGDNRSAIDLLRQYRQEHVHCQINTWASNAADNQTLRRDNRCPLCKEADALL